MCVCVCVYICCFLVAKLCLTLGDLKDCHLLGPSIRGISQARILEWVAISYIYTFFFRFFSLVSYYKILIIVSCAIQ